MTVPKILKFGTIFENENGKIELSGFSFLGNGGDFLGSCVDAVIARLKEEPRQFADFKYKAQEQPLITAAEARKLGAGKAEWSSERPSEATKEHWYKYEDGCSYDKYSVVTGFPVKYRAIKQPEPVEPHAELKAMYAQQVKNTAEGKAGGLEDFIWEYKLTEKNEEFALIKIGLGKFYPDCEYRCTTKPTCQVRNLDTGKLKTMTREAAKLLQAELGDTVEWFTAVGNLPFNNEHHATFDFTSSGIYTYKLKQPKLIPLDWKNVPVGVMTNKGELRKVIYTRHVEGARMQVETNQNSSTANVREFYSAKDLELAPASQQPWIAKQDGIEYPLAGFTYVWKKDVFKVTGLAEGWVLK